MLLTLLTLAHAAGWVLEHPRLVDASGAREVDTLVVDGDTIVHIGPARPDDAELPHVDATGLSLVPGLVDAHVHLSMAPGGHFADRSAAETEARRHHHLKAYVASGVAAVLDTGATLENAQRIRFLADTALAPTVVQLGPLVSPPGGYVAAVLPEFEPTPDVRTLNRQLTAFDRLDPLGVKVTMEDGMLGDIWPWQTDAVLAALADQRRPLFVHAMEPGEYRLALDRLPVHAFVHPLDTPEPDLLERLQGIPVVTTLSVFDHMLVSAEPERLDAPLWQRTVPADELERAGDKATIKESYRFIADHILPNSPGLVRGLMAGGMRMKGPLKGRVKKMQKAVAALHAAGVPLVMGSDSGNWPVFLTEFHGPTSVREVELLGEAGLDPLEVIRISTLNGAELLRLDERLGTLEVGKEASFLALPADPLTDLSLLREPVWIAFRGERRTSAEWMAGR